MNKKFHLRRRSSTTSPFNKDLPVLPHESEPATSPRIPFPTAGIENVPRKRKVSGTPPLAGARTGIMRRVSSIFASRKKPPSNLNLRGTPLHSRSNIHPYMGSNSSESFAESEDDIRRPSGLGSAISLSSNRTMPPSPFTPLDKDSPFNIHVEDESSGYHRARSTSTPNLLQTIAWRAKGKPRERHDSDSPIVTFLQSMKQKISSPPPREIPVEVAILILSYLPLNTVSSLASISKSFVSAARITLYRHVDLHCLSPVQLEKLIAVLATRPELTDQVQRFSCPAWPSFFRAAESQRAGNIGHEDDHRNALLTATFTLAFQRMSNLTHITLPGVDASLLAHHTAFGLKSITLLCERMNNLEKEQLFQWLDGQTNITELRLPHILDFSDDDTCNITRSNTSQQTKSICIPKHNYSRSNSMLFPFPSPPAHIPSPSSSPTLTPQTPSFVTTPTTPVFPYCSPTLLPRLEKLHASPSVVLLLVSTLERPHSPFSSNTMSSTSKRPLSHVILNVSNTLYTGLRPASLVAPLRGISHLGLRFTDNVDRRTVEKVLGAAGTTLGSAKDKGVSDGLQTLVVQIVQNSAESDEILYKTVQSVLPRYSALRSLRLYFSDSEQLSREFDSVDAELQKYRPLLGVEQARKEMWIKQCPLLEEIVFLSGRFWRRHT
ncbi:hypothetical protein BDQ17DRAFT_1353945 [Cyathus striatus]|nr:hypothetical protein BDQ17DRAFT_1353945 [Cyathus striatus]